MFKIFQNKETIPEGFRNLSSEEAKREFALFDKDGSYVITKNEWMAHCLELLFKDIKALNNEGPDSVMKMIQELSDEFDRYDLDNNKVIDYIEFQNFLKNNIYISE